MSFEAWAKRTNRCGALILEILWLFHIYVTLQEGIVLWKQWRWLSSPFFPSLLLPNSGMTIFFLGSTGGYLEGLQRGVPFIAGYPSLADWARGVGCIETRSIGGLLAPSFTDAHANAAGDASGVWFKKKRRRKVSPTESRDFLCPLVN